MTGRDEVAQNGGLFSVALGGNMQILEHFRARIRSNKSRHLSSAIAIILFGVAMSTGVQGVTRIAVPTVFEDLSVEELLSVYKEAYVGAGFEFKEQTTRTDQWKQNRTHLVFEFSIPGLSNAKKGMASFNLDSSNLTSSCRPCSVYAEVFGGEIFGSEWDALWRRMLAARKKAEVQIKAKLGNNIRSAPPDDLGSEVD